jgi:hypothetical protein
MKTEVMPGERAQTLEGADGFRPGCTAPAAPSRRAITRKRDQRLRRFKRQLLAVAEHLREDEYAPLIQSFGRISLLVIDGYEVLRAGGLLNKDGELRSSVDTFQRLVGQQLKLARELGLTPSAIGKLGAGGRGPQEDADFEQRVKRVHAERHGDENAEE